MTESCCPFGSSHPVWEVKFARVASMVVQVERAEHFSATQHVALHYTLKCPRILVVLLPFCLLLLHGCKALSAHNLK